MLILATEWKEGVSEAVKGVNVLSEKAFQEGGVSNVVKLSPRV
jgi:hypothetical protein